MHSYAVARKFFFEVHFQEEMSQYAFYFVSGLITYSMTANILHPPNQLMV